MAQRLRFEVRKTSDGWGFFSREGILHSEVNKRWLVQTVGWELRRAWEGLRVRSELVIKRADGTIQDTRTYGDDPRRTKG